MLTSLGETMTENPWFVLWAIQAGVRLYAAMHKRNAYQKYKSQEPDQWYFIY